MSGKGSKRRSDSLLPPRLPLILLLSLLKLYKCAATIFGRDDIWRLEGRTEGRKGSFPARFSDETLSRAMRAKKKKGQWAVSRALFR